MRTYNPSSWFPAPLFASSESFNPRLVCAETSTVSDHFNESEPLSLRGSGDSLMAPLFTGVRWVYLSLPPIHTLSSPLPSCVSIQSQETASERPEGRKGAVSDHIITQPETHSAGLLWAAAASAGFRSLVWSLGLNEGKNLSVEINHTNFDQVWKSPCVCETKTPGVLQTTLPLFFFTPSFRRTTCRSVSDRRTTQRDCLIIPMITCGFVHSAQQQMKFVCQVCFKLSVTHRIPNVLFFVDKQVDWLILMKRLTTTLRGS